MTLRRFTVSLALTALFAFAGGVGAIVFGLVEGIGRFCGEEPRR